MLRPSSSARGERERAILADALAGLVGAPLTEIQTVEQMHASRHRAQRSWPARLGGLAQAPGEPLQPRARPGRPDDDLRLHLALAGPWDRAPPGLTTPMAVLHSFAVTGPNTAVIRPRSPRHGRCCGSRLQGEGERGQGPPRGLCLLRSLRGDVIVQRVRAGLAHAWAKGRASISAGPCVIPARRRTSSRSTARCGRCASAGTRASPTIIRSTSGVLPRPDHPRVSDAPHVAPADSS